jgi:hypothetical protein
MRSDAGQMPTILRLQDFGAAVSQFSTALTSVVDQLADGIEHWTSRAKIVAKNTESFVRANPWQAAGAGALLGLIAGILLATPSRGGRRAARGRRAPEATNDDDSASGV